MRKWRQKLRQIATNSGWKKGRIGKQIWTKIRKMTTRGRTMYFPITKGFPSGEQEAVFDPEEEISEARQLTAAPAQISVDDRAWGRRPWLDYAGNPGLSGANNSVIISMTILGWWSMI